MSIVGGYALDLSKECSEDTVRRYQKRRCQKKKSPKVNERKNVGLKGLRAAGPR